jgi:cell division protein FtsQ
MAVRKQRGATRRQPVRQQTQPIAWSSVARSLVILSVLVSAVAAIAWMHKDDSFPIKHVSVEGDFKHTNKKDLVAAVSPFVKGSFFNVDVVNIRVAAQALPWVNQVQVRRIWPDKIFLQVDEHRAVAQWGKSGLVSENGQVFYPPKNTMPTGLIKMSGYKGGSEVMTQRLIKIHKQMSPLGLRVAHLKMDERRSWQVNFSNGLELQLGRADSQERLDRFAKVYAAGLKQFEEQIKGVDMRYTNGLAVIWKNGQQPIFNQPTGRNGTV